MTARPLTADEQARADRIEQTPAAEESVIERVAQEIHLAMCEDRCTQGPADDHRRAARAAVAVLRGDTAAERERVLAPLQALADELATLAELNEERAEQHHDAGDHESEQYRVGRSLSYAQAAQKLRDALSGDAQ